MGVIRIRVMKLLANPFTASRPILFDREGEPLDFMEYGALRQFRSYCRVAATDIGPLHVSTVWLGHDMGFGVNGPPVIFETMVFGPAPDTLHPELREYGELQWRYCTTEEAEQGHAEICVDIRQVMAKIEMAEQILTDAIERTK